MKNRVVVRAIMKDAHGQLWHVDATLNLSSTMQYLILRETAELVRQWELQMVKGVDWWGGLTLYGVKVCNQRKENGDWLGAGNPTTEKSRPLVQRVRSYNVPS